MNINRILSTASSYAPHVGALIMAACASASPETRHAEAQTAYAAAFADCLAEARVSMTDRSEEQRAAARARYNACRDRVIAQWAVADGGAR